jgi:dTMP kinase
MFITFEGPEGSGKTTQIKIFADRLEKSGISTVITRQPGGSELGAKLRSLLLDKSTLKIDPMAELLMMMADRAQSVHEIIKPALDSSSVVICDRYADSSIAYQGYGRGLDIDFINYLNSSICKNVVPSITFLLDIDPEIGLARQTTITRMEGEALMFHNRVREGYLEIAKQNPNRFRLIDANSTIDSIAEQIWSEYETYCRNRP